MKDKKTTICGFSSKLGKNYHNILMFVNKKNQYIGAICRRIFQLFLY